MQPEDYKEGKHFMFVDSDDKEFTGIGLLEGKYAGVLYHYYKARIVEDEGIGKLQFGYNIVNSGNHDIDDLNKDAEFSKIMGDILTKILMEQHEQIRTQHTQESDL